MGYDRLFTGFLVLLCTHQIEDLIQDHLRFAKNFALPLELGLLLLSQAYGSQFVARINELARNSGIVASVAVRPENLPLYFRI